ncbi:CCA tRNA nucleotidyltransferase [Paenibacillus sp. LMG 31456]|uniref:CCA tRNA nucleotidyltransferase n=1 Tax=Paenibacillus foliorum TaxID=2654974 RepID=A0A972K375_9BACL|nr:CCA tRNA nucleotidyltransferase [Paenibacillus foliorum]NOU97521.1 CCA tRNA nucleotidyltransferase [Paenibacillus foliorum]
MTQDLERKAKKVIRKLLEHGYEAYMVGGCVRDKQLNRPVKDYDIATAAKPEQVQQLFQRTIPTGLQHGTVSVRMDDCLFEVTTFRTESGYEDFRHPTEVQFIDSLYEDLRRRDFTMNAMALDIDGHLIDPFDGVNDMKKNLLRCVGDANERFQEDALRMLRCIRFASQYGLEIENQTWLALLKQAPLLEHIAMERVRMELERMIAEAAPAHAVQLLEGSRLLDYVKQSLRLADLNQEKLSGDWSTLNDPLLKWAYLYLSMGVSAAETEQELRALTFSKQQVEQVRQVIAAAHELSRQLALEPNEDGLQQAWKLTVISYGQESIVGLHQILQASPGVLTELGVADKWSKSLITCGLTWLKDMPVHSLEELDLGGRELLARLSKPAGPWVSKVLAHLLRETALKRLANESDLLLAEAERFYESIIQQESGAHEHK